MKKIICISFAVCYCFVCYAQNDKILSFLKDFNSFVSTVELADSISNKDLNMYKETMIKYSNQYDSIYSKQMNNKQIETYNSYKSRYYKKISKMKTEKVTNKIDSVGLNIDKKIQKGTSTFIGTLKGLFSK